MGRTDIAKRIHAQTGRRATPSNFIIKLDNSAGNAVKRVSLFDEMGFVGTSKTNDGIITVSTPGGIAAFRKYSARHNFYIGGFTYAATSKAQFSNTFSHAVSDFNGKSDGSSPLEAIISNARNNMAQDQSLLNIPFEFVIHSDMDMFIDVGIGQTVELNLNVVEINRAF